MAKYTGSIGDKVYLAEGAVLSGSNINIGDESNIWYNASLRSTHSTIDIGKRTNIQDNCVLHAEPGHPISIGDDVTVGHSAIVHACIVGSGTLIGMGSTIMTDCKIGKNCLIGAGALVTQGTEIPDGMMAFGAPARVRRPLSKEEIEENYESAAEYVAEAAEYL